MSTSPSKAAVAVAAAPGVRIASDVEIPASRSVVPHPTHEATAILLRALGQVVPHEIPQLVEQLLIADRRRHRDPVALPFADGVGRVGSDARRPRSTDMIVSRYVVLLPDIVALEDE